MCHGKIVQDIEKKACKQTICEINKNSTFWNNTTREKKLEEITKTIN